MSSAYGITKEQLEGHITKFGAKYDWCRRKENNADLFLTLFENQGYRVATYSMKTKQVILTCPQWHLPPTDILEKFINLCEKGKTKSE